MNVEVFNKNGYVLLENVVKDVELLEDITNDFIYLPEAKNKYMKYIISLYFNLKDNYNNDYKELIEKIGSKLDNYEYKLYMMKELGHLLPPLNFWDTVEKRLDSWQKDVINFVNDKESVLVKAPTSAGKTFIAMSTGIIHKKIIYVCPA